MTLPAGSEEALPGEVMLKWSFGEEKGAWEAEKWWEGQFGLGKPKRRERAMQSALRVAEARGTWGRIHGKGIVSHSVGTGFSRERGSIAGFQAWVTISSQCVWLWRMSGRKKP